MRSVVAGGIVLALVALTPVWASAQTPAGVPEAAPAGCALAAKALKVPGEPWAQQVLNLKEAWELSTGRGVRVAVIDSGVDFTHPQLQGQAAAKPVDLTRTGPDDCLGHGTGVAGIIAARVMPGVPFIGVAPSARILSIKIAATDQNNSDTVLAQGIIAAVRLKADVINVSAQTPVDSPQLRSAVAAALKHDIVVVAAAGNVDPKQTGDAVPVYPAQYPGVLSVGATDNQIKVTAFSDLATRVSVVAPGSGIVSTWPHKSWGFDNEGTSFAAPFVAGVAALVRSAHPELTEAQVTQRIEVTADGSKGTGSGFGLIDPLQAVSAVLPADTATPAARSVQVSGTAKPDGFSRTLGLSLAGGALGGTILTIACGLVIPRGRRRNWRPGSIKADA